MTGTRAQPDWQPLMIDGEPLEVINRAAVEEMIRRSPLGQEEARRRMNEASLDAINAGVIDPF